MSSVGYELSLTMFCARQNESIAESRTYTSMYSHIFLDAEDAKHTSSSIYCYDGDGPVPVWFDENRGTLQCH